MGFETGFAGKCRYRSQELLALRPTGSASAIHDPEVDADAVWSRPAPATLDRPLATLLV